MSMKTIAFAPGIPLGRLLARGGRLALPAVLAIVVLLIAGEISASSVLIAILLGLAVSLVLAFARERRLKDLETHLHGLIADSGPSGFHVLGGDTLPVMLDQVERSLLHMRTRQDELNQMLATLLDALPDPVLLVLHDRSIERANRSAHVLFGHDATGEPIEAVLRDPAVLAALDDVLAESDRAEVNIQLPGPPTRAFGVRVVPASWHEKPAALISLRELTEQVMIERMRADFVANASHELRTPLTVIRGFVETLAGPAKDDTAARERFLRTMGAEAARMSRLVDDLLSLSRIEQNEHRPPVDRVEFKTVIDSVLDALRPYAEQRTVAMKLVLADDLPPVIGERDQLMQLFTNLIDNAIKYGGSGGEITVQAAFAPKAQGGAGPLTGRPALTVALTDRGPGIAAEHLPRLTERFFRVDPALSRHLGGTGLGLAIVKHILRRHRGHIAFESALGEGTTVYVYLPTARTEGGD